MNIVSDVALKPHDVAVAVQVALAGPDWTYASLAQSLAMSASEVHGAVHRLTRSGLVHQNRRANVTALLEFLQYGVRYVFPAERGPLTRGLPTSHAAPPLSSVMSAGDDPPPVWPDPEGTVRGESLVPLLKSAPKAAKADGRLYQALALVDALRGGQARERQLAQTLLKELLTR
jgi:hypothetical protein